jgi:hypothetical protein
MASSERWHTARRWAGCLWGHGLHKSGNRGQIGILFWSSSRVPDCRSHCSLQQIEAACWEIDLETTSCKGIDPKDRLNSEAQRPQVQYPGLKRR